LMFQFDFYFKIRTTGSKLSDAEELRIKKKRFDVTHYPGHSEKDATYKFCVRV